MCTLTPSFLNPNTTVSVRIELSVWQCDAIKSINQTNIHKKTNKQASIINQHNQPKQFDNINDNLCNVNTKSATTTELQVLAVFKYAAMIGEKGV